MESWAQEKGHRLRSYDLYSGTSLPLLDQFDMLLIMGGPMSVHDHVEFPWLLEERALIGRAYRAGKWILGICLGAQNIALSLGGGVIPGKEKEIGWFPLKEWDSIPPAWKDILPEGQPVFHWHGETFLPPKGALPLWKSEACEHQGFLLGNRVLALQFHLETTVESCKMLIENSRDELIDSPFVQREEQLLSSSVEYSNPDEEGLSSFDQLNSLLCRLMDRWFGS